MLVVRLTRAVALVAVLIAVGVSANSASAANYCSPAAVGPYGTCAGPYQVLNNNYVFAENSVNATCAGARDGGGSFYGQYFCASSYSCHVYDSRSLTPLAHSHEAFNQTIYGSANFSSQSPCPRGGPVARDSGPGISEDVTTFSAAGVEAKTCLQMPDPVDGVGITCELASVVSKRGLAGSMEPGPQKGPVPASSKVRVAAIAPATADHAVVTAASNIKTTAAVDAQGIVDLVVGGTLRNVDWVADGKVVASQKMS